MKKVFTKIAGLSVGLALAIGVGVAVGSKEAKVAKATDASVTISSYATAHSWVNETKYTTINVDSVVTATTVGTGNTGKYYTNGNNWRIYQSGGGGVTISVGSGYSLDSAAFTFSVTNTGILKDPNNNTVTSRTAVSISGASATFTVGNSGTVTNGQVRITRIDVSYHSSGSDKPMTIKLNDSEVGPFNISYSSSDYLFYAKDGSTTVDAEWTVGSSSIITVSENENHVAVVKTVGVGTTTLNATANGYLAASAEITVTAGTVSSVKISGTMNKTRYAVGSLWNPEGFAVEATYSTGYKANVTSEATWEFENSPSSTSITSTVAYATFDGVKSSGWAQAVTVYEGQGYELSENWDTYSAEWSNSYTSRSISASTDLGAARNASISFTYASKQGGTVTGIPVTAAKSGQESTMSFVLDSAVSESYTISSVEIEFVQWASNKKVGAALYKGTSASGDVLDSFDYNSTPRTLSYSNLNGDSFIVDFTTNQSNNQQLGVRTISVGLEEKTIYGKTDHIKVTSFPRTVYHVGETYDATGLVVTAYDGADESTANYKDVTAKVNTGFVGGIYVFQDEDVPTVDMFVEYTDEDHDVFAADDITMHVYAMAEYELVTSAPTDWSGSYLIVSSYTVGEEEHTVAINSALTSFDQPLNFVEVSVDGTTITSGQECEFTVKPYSDVYSVQGKNGKYAYGSSVYRFQTSDSEQKISFAMGEESVVTITGASSYNLRLNTTPGSERFGFYKDGVSNVKLYKLVESSAATQYAQTFMGAFTCDSTGENKPSFGIKEGSTKWTWALLASEYNKLSAADKELFRLGAPSSAEGASDIAKALARYDYIVGKYFVTGLDESFTDFMERNPSPVASGSIQRFDMVGENNNTMIIVISIAAVSALAFTTLLVFKKKKQK